MITSDPNSSSDEEPESLTRILTRHLIRSKFAKTPYSFVPRGDFDRVITQESVLAALNVSKPDEVPRGLISFILQDAKRVFATTAFTQLKPLLRAMILFRDNNFDDSKLPVEDPTSLGDTQHTLAALEGHLRRKNKIWTEETMYNFHEHQWKFLVPVFSTAEPNHDFGEHIVPFTERHVNCSEGAFGMVSKYTIHPDHMQDPISPNNIPTVFAVKEIKADNQEDRQKVARHWASEARALARMNTLNQEHIVRFITAFRRRTKDGEEHYLMFEWANGGNLRTLWKTTPRPKLEPGFLKAAVRQLFGLAEALSAAHYLNDNGASYRHGDLKPANILWFRDKDVLGKLKIGDWGEAKEHDLVTELRPSKTTAEYGTRRYEAPEVETGLRLNYHGQAAKRRSRLYDVWAMGCITLEFLIWLLYGVEELDRFNRSFRGDFNNDSSYPFYQIEIENRKKVARVHDTVVEWMEHMARDPACRPNTALGDLLEVVRTGLIVVKLPKRMGTMQFSPNKNNGTLQVPVPGRFPRPGDRPAVKLPSIAVTPTEPERIPVQPEPEMKGPARLLATEFRERLDKIVSEDEEEDYWSPGKPGRPPSLNAESLTVAMGSTGIDSQDDTQDAIDSGPTHSGTSSSGLNVLGTRRVSLPPACLNPQSYR